MAPFGTGCAPVLQVRQVPFDNFWELCTHPENGGPEQTKPLIKGIDTIRFWGDLAQTYKKIDNWESLLDSQIRSIVVNRAVPRDAEIVAILNLLELFPPRTSKGGGSEASRRALGGF